MSQKHVERLTGNNKVLYSVILLEFFDKVGDHNTIKVHQQNESAIVGV
jgi:hypothetical protein